MVFSFCLLISCVSCRYGMLMGSFTVVHCDEFVVDVQLVVVWSFLVSHGLSPTLEVAHFLK